MGKLINKDQLLGTIAHHKIWLGSDKKRGAQAKFFDTDFYISSYHPLKESSQIHRYLYKKPSDKKVLERTDFHSTRTLMQGVLLENSIFDRCRLDGVLLQGAILEKSEIINSVLTKIRLKGAHLEKCRIKKTRINLSYLRSIRFDKSEIDTTNFSGSFCDRASFIQTRIFDSNFSRTYLIKTNFSDSVIKESTFNKSKLRKSKFENSKIIDCTFKNTIFSHSHINKSLIEDSSFEGSNCSFTDFSNTKFIRVDLKNVNFDNSNLTNISFQATDVSGASFKNIILDQNTYNLLPPWVIDKFGDSFSLIDSIEKLSEIKKSIYFEPEYRQAGIGILSYFSNVLESVYPNKDIRFKIEQNPPIVSLVIETPEGDLIEKIEKTLEDYGDVVLGNLSIEEFTDDHELTIGLEKELEYTKLRLELELKSVLLEEKKQQIVELYKLLNISLKKEATILINNENRNMGGDTYNAEQVAIQGPNAHADNITLSFDSKYADIDFDRLSKELDTLLEQLKANAKDPKHYSEILAIANAKEEACKSNGFKVLQELKKAGQWSVDIAQKIGVGVAVAVIKSAAGL